MSKILVTGADGFIGSHLVEELVRQGHDVRAIVLYNSYNSWGWLDHADARILNQVEVVSSDIRNPFAMAKAVSSCDIVLHLAALIAIPYSYVAPESYVSTNVQGTLNLLQAARDNGVHHFVHTSTSEVYGTARFVPITEDHPLQPQSPYSASKIGADCMALSYQMSFGLPVTVIRPFNTYGPRQSTRAVIPTIITQIAAGNRVVKLGATHPTRDFNFVSDTVSGVIAVINSRRAIGQAVNIGSNFEISIGDTAKLIAEVMGVEIEIIDEATRIRPESSEVERLWADNSKAAELLSWTPNYGGREGFARGLKETADWFCVPANLALYKTGGYTI